MTQSASTRMGAWHTSHNDFGDAQLFAVGDVHGRAQALAEGISAIAAIPRTAERRVLVFLGDIIDRGPDNLAAIQLVLNAQRLAHVDEVVFLPGNHELMLLDALEDPFQYMGNWLRNGGRALIAEASAQSTTRHLSDPVEVVQRIVPRAFLKLIHHAPSHLRLGNLIFVHAGLAPNEAPEAFLSLPGAAAVDAHWAWIMKPFLEWKGGWGPERQRLSVHGHTSAVRRLGDASRFFAFANRKRTHGRICLDAGAAFGLPQVGWAEFQLGKFRLALSRAG